MLGDMREEAGWTITGSVLFLSLATMFSIFSFNGTQLDLAEEAAKTAMYQTEMTEKTKALKLKDAMLKRGMTVLEVKCLLDDPKGSSPVCIIYAAQGGKK